MEKIRKEIHLPSQIIRDLKIVAAHSDKSVKKYMEDLVMRDVQSQITKLSKPH